MKMPRQARKQSASGIYHVMLRGINQQQIFEDSEDFKKFLEILRDCQTISCFELYAYCLMDNHIHLLIKPQKESLEQIIKRIGGRYVYWYNAKYSRIGHLFQDRYKSEPVEDNSYFLTVLRYIHQNPVKAGICEHSRDYLYSSYNEYSGIGETANCDFVYQLISKEEFETFHNYVNADNCLEVTSSIKLRLTDEQAKKLIQKHTKCNSISEFQLLDTSNKNKYIKMLWELGVSIRQLSRLTGETKGMVEKRLKM